VFSEKELVDLTIADLIVLLSKCRLRWNPKADGQPVEGRSSGRSSFDKQSTF
jgi:hypothetical protein